MKWWISILALLIVVWLINSQRSVLQSGAAAPPIAAGQWFNTDQQLSLETLKGRIVVIEFWATWCAPCVQSIPKLNQLHAKWQDRGVAVIGLSDEPADVIRSFIERTGIRYIVGAGSTSDVQYGVRAIPHAFVIDPSGRIVWQGYPDAALDRALTELSARHAPAPPSS